MNEIQAWASRFGWMMGHLNCFCKFQQKVWQNAQTPECIMTHFTKNIKKTHNTGLKTEKKNKKKNKKT